MKAILEQDPAPESCAECGIRYYDLIGKSGMWCACTNCNVSEYDDRRAPFCPLTIIEDGDGNDK